MLLIALRSHGSPNLNDDNLWLEDVDGTKALDWVKAQNERSLKQLQEDPRYKTVEKEFEDILLAPDRLPEVAMHGNMVYNFWQDDKSARGILRRTTLKDFEKNDPAWETVLDLDKLAADENENWVFKGISYLPPGNTRGLVSLSRGGKDAVVIREYDLANKAFIKDGFCLPEAKSAMDWIDLNHVFVGTCEGDGSLTDSGYPARVRLWTRGETLSSAPTLLQVPKEHVETHGYKLFDDNIRIVGDGIDFYTETNYLVADDLTLAEIPFPRSSTLEGAFKGFLLARLRQSWVAAGKQMEAGALVSLPVSKVRDRDFGKFIEVVYTPDAHSSLEEVHTTHDAIYITHLRDVSGRLSRITRSKNGWATTAMKLPENGTVAQLSSDYGDTRLLLCYQDFLTPASLFVIGEERLLGTTRKPRLLKQAPKRFDDTPYRTEQRFTASRDGTRIPYYVIARKDMKPDGNNPVLLYGYGGFEISLTPAYLARYGKTWLDRGGALVYANIRGGNEYGPNWHKAAVLENRQKAYDDFIAVAEDLVHRKTTSARRLAIMGGSNGGLLVSTVMIERPDLFHAVVCQVPLTDMLRYNQLLAGASWMAEYGNPDDPQMREALLKYSPYQNASPDIRYPAVFFETSTKDDRVHPGHARKLAARLLSYGNPVSYYENIEGGHGAAANLRQQVTMRALYTVFLLQNVVD
jgi:prolyl oligopeptidase